MDTRESYEALPYENFAFPGSNPNRLAAILAHHGHTAPDVARARVLELGCAAGSNLLPMAEQFPFAQFVGVDLSASQIGAGQAMLDACALENVKLVEADLATLDRSWGTFDFIVAHGLYSWVPREVQDMLMAICRDHLSPDGCAYISYNTLPGWGFKGALREMLIFHSAAHREPLEKVDASRKLIDMLAKTVAPGFYADQLGDTAKRLAEMGDGYLFHEFLEPNNFPVLFHQFIANASRFDLEYVAESTLNPFNLARLGTNAQAEVARLANGDHLKAEQYLDFLVNRSFRASVLRKKDGKSRVPGQPIVIDDALWVSMVARHKESDQAGGLILVLDDGRRVTLNPSNRLLHAAISIILLNSPKGIQIAKLRHLIADALGNVESPELMRDIDNALTEAMRHGVVEMTQLPWPCANSVPARPALSPFARRQAASASDGLVSLNHKLIYPPQQVRDIARQLDGTRTVEGLIAELSATAPKQPRDILPANGETPISLLLVKAALEGLRSAGFMIDG